MKKIMFVGPVGVGKSSLIKVLTGHDDIVRKTQAISFCNDIIDTPGEYAQIPRFYCALVVTALEARLVVVVQDASAKIPSLPPDFSRMFICPVIGVVSKIDHPEADLGRARDFLFHAGVQGRVFCVSSFTLDGIKDLYSYFYPIVKREY